MSPSQSLARSCDPAAVRESEPFALRWAWLGEAPLSLRVRAGIVTGPLAGNHPAFHIFNKHLPEKRPIPLPKLSVRTRKAAGSRGKPWSQVPEHQPCTERGCYAGGLEDPGPAGTGSDLCQSRGKAQGELAALAHLSATKGMTWAIVPFKTR